MSIMILMSFIPVNAKENVRYLINKHKLNIITVPYRKTKRGDFRVYSNGSKKITLNEDLNKFRFLITLLHEIAHQLVFQTFGFIFTVTQFIRNKNHTGIFDTNLFTSLVYISMRFGRTLTGF